MVNPLSLEVKKRILDVFLANNQVVEVYKKQPNSNGKYLVQKTRNTLDLTFDYENDFKVNLLINLSIKYGTNIAYLKKDVISTIDKIFRSVEEFNHYRINKLTLKVIDLKE